MVFSSILSLNIKVNGNILLSSQNKPNNSSLDDKDFTIDHYTELLLLAKKNFKIASYDDKEFSENSLLWRHDVDFSLIHSLVLAKIENKYGIKSTYFINPHSDFYNIAEKSQTDIIKELVSLGHSLGLHLDCRFYQNSHNYLDSNKIDKIISYEADYIESISNFRPIAFSFHNPTEKDLKNESISYGGLINCYSKWFKAKADYCSDSNGYWRFKRLYDVLSEKPSKCLQVLTHPGWWHNEPLPPRTRVFKILYDRASINMSNYDFEREEAGRLNQTGKYDIGSLKSLKASEKDLCDYLYTYKHFDSLLIELWKIHNTQLRELLFLYLHHDKKIPLVNLKIFFNEIHSYKNVFYIFFELLNNEWDQFPNLSIENYDEFRQEIEYILNGTLILSNKEYKKRLIKLNKIIKAFTDWEESKQLNHTRLTNIEIKKDNTFENFNQKEWEEFLARIKD